MRKCINCSSNNVNESGPYAYWKFGDTPIDDKPRVVYFSCLDCFHSWKQVNEGDLRVVREFSVKPENGGAWITTSGGSEFFATKRYAAKFQEPIKKDGEKASPKCILGEILYLPEKNVYAVTIEYDDGTEEKFKVPSLRGWEKGEDGMKVIADKDGLVSCKEAPYLRARKPP